MEGRPGLYELGVTCARHFIVWPRFGSIGPCICHKLDRGNVFMRQNVVDNVEDKSCLWRNEVNVTESCRCLNVSTYFVVTRLWEMLQWSSPSSHRYRTRSSGVMSHVNRHSRNPFLVQPKSVVELSRQRGELFTRSMKGGTDLIHLPPLIGYTRRE